MCRRANAGTRQYKKETAMFVHVVHKKKDATRLPKIVSDKYGSFLFHHLRTPMLCYRQSDVLEGFPIPAASSLFYSRLRLQTLERERYYLHFVYYSAYSISKAASLLLCLVYY